MITQAIKGWLHKLFAWWPWKQPTQVEHTPVIRSMNKGPAPEAATRSTIDGVAPQAGVAPRLSTIEEWPERVVQSHHSPPNEPVESAPPANLSAEKKPEPASTVEETAQAVPTHLQRLEFLRYLVKRGIVNEGFEEEK